MNKGDAEDLGVSSLGRVRVKLNEKELTAISRVAKCVENQKRKS